MRVHEGGYAHAASPKQHFASASESRADAGVERAVLVLRDRVAVAQARVAHESQTCGDSGLPRLDQEVDVQQVIGVQAQHARSRLDGESKRAVQERPGGGGAGLDLSLQDGGGKVESGGVQGPARLVEDRQGLVVPLVHRGAERVDRGRGGSVSLSLAGIVLFQKTCAFRRCGVCGGAGTRGPASGEACRASGISRIGAVGRDRRGLERCDASLRQHSRLLPRG